MNSEFEQSLGAMVPRNASHGVDVSSRRAGIHTWFERHNSGHLPHEMRVRLEERHKERARIARDLHDTLFQGFFGASMVLHAAVESLPPDSPSRPSLHRALVHMRRVLDEGRSTLLGLRSSYLETTDLERALADLGNQFTANGTKFKISVLGRPKPLLPAMQHEVLLIAREALTNAWRHAHATCIEAEIEYLPAKLRLTVRDNGSGIDPEVVRCGRESHWGLQGMRERARNIGGQLRIWSRRGAGTEVEILIPSCLAQAARNPV